MGILYLTRPDISLKKQGGRLAIADEFNKLSSIPLKDIERIMVCSKAQISTQLIYELLDKGVPISYLNYRGDLMGVLTPFKTRVNRILEQARIYDDKTRKIELVRKIIKEKIEKQAAVLNGYNKRLKNKRLYIAAALLKHFLELADAKADLGELRGIEGIAAKKYFECFTEIIGNKDFVWQGRKKRPAPDPINSMLSFSYTLMANEVALAVKANGLDSNIGYLHELDNYRESLVYDFMEYFRPDVDKMVISAINLKRVSLEDFETTEQGACYFKETARRMWYQYFEECMLKSNAMYEGSLRANIKTKVNEFAKSLERKDEGATGALVANNYSVA